MRLTLHAALSISLMQQHKRQQNKEQNPCKTLKQKLIAKSKTTYTPTPHAAITPDMAVAAQALILAGWRPPNPKLAQLEKDKERLDWLASTEQNTGQVLLPTDCVVKNVGSLRGAIDSAMRISRIEAMAEKL